MLRIYNSPLSRIAPLLSTTAFVKPSTAFKLPPFRTYLRDASLVPRHHFQPYQIRHDFLYKNNSISLRSFHATRRNEYLPLLCFKSTLFINWLQTAVRVVFTLVPIALMRKHVQNKWIRKLEKFPDKFPDLEAKRSRLLKKVYRNTIFVKTILSATAGLVGLVMLSSIERTPLTGRIRLIVVSPEEEESITRDLSGSGWYDTVRDILTTSQGPPKFISPSDWRYQWVERTLRRIESVIPALQDEDLMRQAWLTHIGNDGPYPPPPEYPLLPRARVSQRLHYLESPGLDPKERPHHAHGDAAPHSLLGPPYSLVITDEPEQSNAFSYGFGPNGSGGVVLFSGFLDEIFRNTAPPAPPPSQSTLSSFLSYIFPSTGSTAPPVPTPEQETQLAILVAHELSHLLLSHHLETLSSVNVFWPTLVSIITDLFRTLLFPITMIGGPFLNDALEQVGEVGKRELTTAADSCSSQRMEIEADVVSIRLLALAGYDPRAAVKFWESRANTPLTPEVRQQAVKAQLPGVLPGALWVSQDGGVQSGSHPIDEVRVTKLKEELQRWDLEKKRALQTVSAMSMD